MPNQTNGNPASDGATCSASDTPETEREWFAAHQTNRLYYGDDQLVTAGFARKLERELNRIRCLLVITYNTGYMAGHHDTVEAQFVPIHHTDMDTYHAEEVCEIIQQNAQASRGRN